MNTVLDNTSLALDAGLPPAQDHPETSGRLRAGVPTLVIIAVSLILALPIIRFGLPFGHDAVEHLSWYHGFSAQLWSGEAYPRWLLEMNSGLGSPDLFVYGPLPYYAAAAFRVFSSGLGWETRELGLSIWLALCLSGIAAYLWLAAVVGGRLAPTIAAVIYMLAPYHLKTDLYTRSALAEFWAFAWMPLILYFTTRLMKGHGTSAIAGLSVSYGCLLATHLFTALLFSPIALIYALFLAPGFTGRYTVAIKVTLGLLLGAALSGIYLLPALAWQKYISPYKLIESRPELYRFDQFFLFSSRISSDPFLRTVSWLTAWTALVAAGAFAVACQVKGQKLRREVTFWAIVAAIGVIMMLPLSSFIWQRIPQLRAIQFPWRFNTILVLSLAVLVGLAVDSLRKQRNRLKVGIAVCTLFLILGWIVPTRRSMASQRSWVRKGEPYSQDYLITAWAQWTSPSLLTPLGVKEIAHEGGDTKLLSDNNSAKLIKWTARSIEFQAVSDSDTWVTIKQFYCPGWVAMLASGQVLALKPHSPDGLMSVRVPVGNNDVRLILPRGKAEILGAEISGIAGLLIIVLLGSGFKRSVPAE